MRDDETTPEAFTPHPAAILRASRQLEGAARLHAGEAPADQILVFAA